MGFDPTLREVLNRDHRWVGLRKVGDDSSSTRSKVMVMDQLPVLVQLKRMDGGDRARIQKYSRPTRGI